MLRIKTDLCIIVADNYLEPRFEKISKKFRKWHGVLSANLEPETKTTGF